MCKGNLNVWLDPLDAGLTCARRMGAPNVELPRLDSPHSRFPLVCSLHRSVYSDDGILTIRDSTSTSTAVPQATAFQTLMQL